MTSTLSLTENGLEESGLTSRSCWRPIRGLYVVIVTYRGAGSKNLSSSLNSLVQITAKVSHPSQVLKFGQKLIWPGINFALAASIHSPRVTTLQYPRLGLEQGCRDTNDSSLILVHS
jgi:hypothetical protein